MTSRAKALWLTSRPKTLSASFIPVITAHALVLAEGRTAEFWISACALLASIFIQIGTNFVNDALDFIKGADAETRLGDARASQQGWFTHKFVLSLGIGCFVVAAAFGLPLVIHGGIPILIVGLISLLMGYAYTGGPFPLAYVGLGDLFVIVFFGLVAVSGVVFLHTSQILPSALVCGLQIGLLATVMIAINNLRDLEQDQLVNKRTLAVRLGPRLGRYEVVALVMGAFLLNSYWLHRGYLLSFLLPILALPLGIYLLQRLLNSQADRTYNRLLALGSLLHILFGLLLSLGFVFR